MLLTLSLLALGYALGQQQLFVSTLSLLYRLKWLFVSILFIYLFLSPSLHFDLHSLNQNLSPGLTRIANLMLLIAAVNLLVRSGDPHEFMQALLWLLRPLQVMGLPSERIAVRMALCMDMVAQLQAEFAKPSVTKPKSKSRRHIWRHYLGNIANLAHNRVAATLAHIQAYPLKRIEISMLGAPGWLQCGLLGLLIGLYLWL